jgi:PTS system N-acetylglucosamine-specific IIC component
MYHCSKKENKKKVGSILFSAALASFFTGVTEPLEFAFMFVAPILYLIHAFLTGMMLFIAASLKWMAGFGFSAGLIDYILSFKSPFANNILFLIPLGVICGVIYYVIFRMLILRYDLMTPGREKIQPKEEKTKAFTYDDMSIELLDALGGKTNVLCVDHCITRLRVEVKNISIIDKQALSNMNFSHIVETSEHEIQIIIGTEVQFIAEILNEILM